MLEFFAPAFDLRVIEDFADDAAQEAFQAGILDVVQGADGLFFITFIQSPRPLVGFKFCVEGVWLGVVQ